MKNFRSNKMPATSWSGHRQGGHDLKFLRHVTYQGDECEAAIFVGTGEQFAQIAKVDKLEAEEQHGEQYAAT